MTSSKAIAGIRALRRLWKCLEEPKNLNANGGLQGGEGDMGGRAGLASAPHPRSNKQRAPCPHSKGTAEHWVTVIFFEIIPQIFLLWQGTENGRGREMSRTSKNLRISTPMQSGGGLCHFWGNVKGVGVMGFFLRWSLTCLLTLTFR